MVRQDLVYGLKNAIERGASLEQAKQSFISAGYSLEEVEEAAIFFYSEFPGISSGSSIIEKQEEIPIPSRAIQKAVLQSQPQYTQYPPQPQQSYQYPPIQQQYPQQPYQPIQEKESFLDKLKRNWKILLLVGILSLLLIILIITIIYRDKIIVLFS